jgi:hypothetical protein
VRRLEDTDERGQLKRTKYILLKNPWNPTNLSATEFMSGARTAVLITRIPTPSATRSNDAPNLPSRSRNKIFGGLRPSSHSAVAGLSTLVSGSCKQLRRRLCASPGAR